ARRRGGRPVRAKRSGAGFDGPWMDHHCGDSPPVASPRAKSVNQYFSVRVDTESRTARHPGAAHRGAGEPGKGMTLRSTSGFTTPFKTVATYNKSRQATGKLYPLDVCGRVGVSILVASLYSDPIERANPELLKLMNAYLSKSVYPV